MSARTVWQGKAIAAILPHPGRGVMREHVLLRSPREVMALYYSPSLDCGGGIVPKRIREDAISTPDSAYYSLINEHLGLNDIEIVDGSGWNTDYPTMGARGFHTLLLGVLDRISTIAWVDEWEKVTGDKHHAVPYFLPYDLLDQRIKEAGRDMALSVSHLLPTGDWMRDMIVTRARHHFT